MKLRYIAIGIFVSLCILIYISTSRPEVRYINVTHTINNTYYLDREVEVTKYINATKSVKCECNETVDAVYLLSLIQQIKACEDNLAKNWNITECQWEIQKYNQSLIECNESLNTIKGALE